LFETVKLEEVMKIKIVTLISLLLFVTGISSAQIKQVPSPKVTKQTTKPSAYTLPVGTIIRVKMGSDISSATAKVNDTFTTMLIGPILVRGTEILPADTKVEGRITKVVKATKKSEAGRLQVIFEKIMLPDGEVLQIDGELVSISEKAASETEKKQVKGESSAKENVALIGGGAAIGAVIGAVAGGGSGAAVGAAVGAGVGTGGALLRKGNEAMVKANSELSISLKEEVTLPVKDY
jgi:hypothetical protein